NSQSRAMEEALRRRNIPYRVVGGVSFYQRKEIKDILAYFRYTLNTNDEQSFRRIINFPKRGVGDSSVNKLIVIANDQGASLWDVVCNVNSLLTGRACAAIEGFADQIKSFQIVAGSKDAFEAASHM